MQNIVAEIQKKETAISVEKENGTLVDYYLRDNFEVHNNVIPTGVVQDWHAHLEIEEIILILEGKITLEQVHGTKITSTILEKGDLVRLNNSIHRFLNNEERPCHFVVFRFATEEDVIIKEDKLPFSTEEIAFLQKNGIKKAIEQTKDRRKSNFLLNFMK